MTKNNVVSVPVKDFQRQYKKEKSKVISMLNSNFEYLTVQECAAMIKGKVKEVRALCRNNYFEGAFKYGKEWRIPVLKESRKDIDI